MDETLTYYVARAEEERQLAADAIDLSVKRIHEKMANEYEGLLRAKERAIPAEQRN